MRILPIFIPHAGCQHECIYCNQQKTSQSLKIPSPGEVLAEVASALDNAPLDEVAYYGGSFTALPISVQATYLDLLQPFLADGRIRGVRLSTRPDAIDAGIADFLKSSGVTTVELGCQSFSDQVLRAAGRGHLPDDAFAAAAILRDRGFCLGIQLMPGLPGAGTAEAMQSLDKAIGQAPDFLRIYPTVVLEDTGLAEIWRRGDYRPFTLEQAVDVCADMALVCRSRSVKVIRFGLQSNAGLDSGAVLDGPYHPAFGQMVRSRLWRRALARVRAEDIDIINVHPSDLSDALGHGRSNIGHIHDRFGPVSIIPVKGIARDCVGVAGQQRSIYALAG